MKLEYIHMGHSDFDKFRFKPISNSRDWVKPYGGLWASPETAPYGWETWVKDNNFTFDLSKWFIFTLKDDAKVLEITNASQLNDLPKAPCTLSPHWVVLDFEEISKSYDAMQVMISSDQQLYWDLYGWDCDTILVFNPDIIDVIRRQ